MAGQRFNSGPVSDWGKRIPIDINYRVANAFGVPGTIWVASGSAENWAGKRLWLSSFFVPQTPIVVSALQIRITTAGSAGSVVGIGDFEIHTTYSGTATPIVVSTVAGDGAAGIKSATGLSTVLSAGTVYGLGLTHDSTTTMGLVRRGLTPGYGTAMVDANDMTQRLVSAVDGYTTANMAALTTVSVTPANAGGPADFSVVFMQWTD